MKREFAPEALCVWGNMPRGHYGHSKTHSGNRNGRWDGGKSSHELNDIYYDMIGRCTRPTHKKWGDYGGRGIEVCERWRSDFWAFVEDMGARPPGKTPGGRSAWQLDRINNDGNYEPSNTRWTTTHIQAKNRRPQSWHGVLRGSKQTLSKLTESQVLEILSRVEAGEVKLRLAGEYGVSASLIDGIYKGKNWNWLTGQKGKRSED